MAKMNPGMRMLAMARMGGEPEMRRRDSRGRYMEGNSGAYSAMNGGEMNGRMEMGGATTRYMPMYLDRPSGNYNRRMTEEPDGQNPYGGQPEVYRKQEEQRMSGKTSGGEINYNRPDGGYGNVRYFMHKTDPMNQRDGQEHFQQRKIGFQAQGNELDKETVMGWVEGMEDDEGVHGGKYSWHQAQQYALNVGVSGQQKVLEFYWAMNAMYADYHKVAKKFGVDKPDFYACLAKAFIEDPDAVEDKVEKYVMHIAKNGGK